MSASWHVYLAFALYPFKLKLTKTISWLNVIHLGNFLRTKVLQALCRWQRDTGMLGLLLAKSPLQQK